MWAVICRAASSSSVRPFSFASWRIAGREAVRADRAGVDGVDADAVAHAAVGQALRQVEYGGVHGPANGELCAARPVAGDEVRPGGPAEAYWAEELQGEARRPVLLTEGQEVTALGGARVVDHQVDAAEAIERRGGKRPRCCRRGEGRGMDQHLTAAGFNPLRQSAQAGLVPGGHGEGPAFFRQAPGDGKADPAARPRDQGDFGRKFQVHRVSERSSLGIPVRPAGHAYHGISRRSRKSFPVSPCGAAQASQTAVSAPGP
jgi:hypothetical protein